MPRSSRRRHIPLGVKLSACLDMLGWAGVSIEWHHDPPLALRAFDESTGKYEPDELDPRYLRPMPKADHKARTYGDHVPLSGDISKVAKLKRVEADQATFRDRLLAKETGDAPPPSKKRRWGKRPFPRRSD